jgi:hypothetical protein
VSWIEVTSDILEVTNSTNLSEVGANSVALDEPQQPQGPCAAIYSFRDLFQNLGES